jgi:hypothetical protein
VTARVFETLRGNSEGLKTRVMFVQLKEKQKTARFVRENKGEGERVS